MTDESGEASPLDLALRRVGDRWSLLIVDALLDGPLRYNDLQEAVSGIATNVLAGRLRHLEAERVVLAVAYSRRPARFAYELTGAGRSLAGALRLLAEWGAGGAGRQGGGARADGKGREGVGRHNLCGTPLQVRLYCPTCDLIADRRSNQPTFV